MTRRWDNKELASPEENKEEFVQQIHFTAVKLKSVVILKTTTTTSRRPAKRQLQQSNRQNTAASFTSAYRSGDNGHMLMFKMSYFPARSHQSCRPHPLPDIGVWPAAATAAMCYVSLRTLSQNIGCIISTTCTQWTRSLNKSSSDTLENQKGLLVAD